MCGICEAQGLSRSCATCGGFDWVSDVYENAVVLRERLCIECRGVWIANGYDRQGMES